MCLITGKYGTSLSPRPIKGRGKEILFSIVCVCIHIHVNQILTVYCPCIGPSTLAVIWEKDNYDFSSNELYLWLTEHSQVHSVCHCLHESADLDRRMPNEARLNT